MERLFFHGMHRPIVGWLSGPFHPIRATKHLRIWLDVYLKSRKSFLDTLGFPKCVSQFGSEFYCGFNAIEAF